MLTLILTPWRTSKERKDTQSEFCASTVMNVYCQGKHCWVFFIRAFFIVSSCSTDVARLSLTEVNASVGCGKKRSALLTFVMDGRNLQIYKFFCIQPLNLALSFNPLYKQNLVPGSSCYSTTAQGFCYLDCKEFTEATDLIDNY